MQYIEAGHIVPEELAADAFAAQQVGRANVRKFLKRTLSTRPKSGMTADNDLGRTELERRLAALRDP